MRKKGIHPPFLLKQADILGLQELEQLGLGEMRMAGMQ